LEANLSARFLEDIEADEIDPPASTLESLASALKVPVTWLFTHPTSFQHLFPEPEEDLPAGSPASDPVTERILTGSRMDRSLYVLLTALIQSAEPKLLRAAEMSLRSLVKQSKQASVPWQSRPSGHFEPPSD
ncbi:MAG TPA: XRE family transcriptional regulator, partial [Nitrospira sp.]